MRSAVCLLTLYSFMAIASSYVILPTPTNQLSPLSVKQTPTPVIIMKRDVEETLSIYQNWADACNKKINHAMIDVSDLQDLRNTETTTIYCGKNKVTKVTRTVTTTRYTKSKTTTKHKKVQCDDKCWSTYLWYTYGYDISVAQGITGIVCIIMSFYFLIFGFSSFRITLGAVGFVFFALMTWVGLVNNEPQFGYPNNDIVYLSVSGSFGVIGAILCIYVYPVALYLVGGLGGLFLALFILSWKDSLVIEIQVARICFLVGMGVLFCILVVLAELYCILLSTSFIGAYLFFIGLDLFIHTGLINPLLFVLNGNKHHSYVYITRTPLYVVLSFIIVLFLISFGWQYYWNVKCQKRSFGINVVEAAPEEEKKEEKPVC
ncbi:hypothetical protein BDB01DRAFT_794615 [Pilobolus umbonatus]|nr:hypothetical protein BDB01DRAFT_794615 [Pilobolus umbonatus]